MSAKEPSDVTRLRKAFAALERHGPGEPVDAERIFDALHGDLSPEERQAVVDQVLTNPEAAEAWRLARDLAPDAASQAAPRGGEGDAPRHAPWKWLAAAAIVLAVGLGWQAFQPRGEEPAYRSVESRTVASALAPGAELSRAQPVLRWTGMDGARYRVRVLTSDLQVLEESPETSAREYTVSQQTLARIPPRGQLLWQVDARIPGEVVVTSPTFSNSVP